MRHGVFVPRKELYCEFENNKSLYLFRKIACDGRYDVSQSTNKSS